MSQSLSLREQLAALAHDQWTGWMVYLFGCALPGAGPGIYLPFAAVERWRRQMTTPYADLPESEKESDRKEADRVLEVVRLQPPADVQTVIEAIDAVPVVAFCNCGRPLLEHTYWEDRVYDVNGRRCPGPTGGDFRFNQSLTTLRHREARAAVLAALVSPGAAHQEKGNG